MDLFKKKVQRKSMVAEKKISFKLRFMKSWQLYIMLIPAVIYFVVFNYMPMYGIQIAFKDYKITQGITGSSWVGLKHFEQFFDTFYFKRLISNTMILNLYGLLFSFPIPVILAIFLNYIRKDKMKRFIQTTIYIPHFISTTVLAGMLYVFLSPSGGIFNVVRMAMGLDAVEYMSEASAFRTIFIGSGIWQGAGYGTILYIASLAGVDPNLYEAAEIDGANIWQKIRYIDIPSVMGTVVISFILQCGNMLDSNTTKALLLQTVGNITKSEILGVYVYNMGIEGGHFSYTAAIGLFVNVVNFIFILLANKISKTVSNSSLF